AASPRTRVAPESRRGWRRDRHDRARDRRNARHAAAPGDAPDRVPPQPGEGSRGQVRTGRGAWPAQTPARGTMTDGPSDALTAALNHAIRATFLGSAGGRLRLESTGMT